MGILLALIEVVSRFIFPSQVPTSFLVTMLVIRFLLSALALAGANPAAASPPSTTPNCGLHRPSKPYHSGKYSNVYKASAYGRLGCNHDAGLPELFGAFAKQVRVADNGPERLRQLAQLARAVQGADGFAKMVTGLMTRGSPSGSSASCAECAALERAVAVFLHPRWRCVADQADLPAMGVQAAVDCRALEVGDDEIGQVLGEFVNALQGEVLVDELRSEL